MKLQVRFRILFAGLLAVAALGLSQSAALAIMFIPDVEIVETFDPITQEGEFTVSNNSEDAIYAFAVANNTATYSSFSSETNYWYSDIIAREDWEAGYTFDWPLPEWTAPDTSTVDWNSTFGSEFDQVIAYWAVDLLEVAGTPIESGNTEGPFLFTSELPASPFIAFGEFGNTVAQGQTSAVPEPASFWLLLVATGLLLGRRRG